MIRPTLFGIFLFYSFIFSTSASFSTSITLPADEISDMKEITGIRILSTTPSPTTVESSGEIVLDFNTITGTEVSNSGTSTSTVTFTGTPQTSTELIYDESQAGDFNGHTQYMSFDVGTEIDTYTFAFWCYFRGFGSARERAFVIDNRASTTDSGFTWFVDTTMSDNVGDVGYDFMGIHSADGMINCSFAPNISKWEHWTLVALPGDGYELYRNGAKEVTCYADTNSEFRVSINKLSGTLYFGTRCDLDTAAQKHFFNAIIDDFYYAPKALSEDQVYALAGLTPTSAPTMPTQEPTSAPTSEPTASPSSLPTREPTSAPTSEPTASPSSLPSFQPTSSPSRGPTGYPTSLPSTMPTLFPSFLPTGAPSALPTTRPSLLPSISPTGIPSLLPTFRPSGLPSMEPTAAPSSMPSPNPTARTYTRVTIAEIQNYTRTHENVPTLSPTKSSEMSSTPSPTPWTASEGTSCLPSKMADEHVNTSGYVTAVMPDQSGFWVGIALSSG